MATYTTSGSGDYGRKFSISRENGTADKNGKPYFFEWLKELPAEAERKGRKFETRVNGQGEQRHYELFAAVAGKLTGFEIEKKTIAGTEERWLVLHMTDGPEDFKIETGKIDGRYSLDIMKRLLDPQFNPNQNLRLSPFALKDKEDKVIIGLSAISGMDGKLSAGREKNPRLDGMAQAASAQFKDRVLWDFEPVAEWLFGQLEKLVRPQLSSGPEAWPTQAPAERVAESVTIGDDDLPF